MCKMERFGNCDLETADQEYCIFHKPNKTEEEAREFYRKFLERFKPKVEEIEVDGRKIKRFVFEKPVDARGFVFPNVPFTPLTVIIDGEKWKFCNLDDCINFRYAIFKENVIFTGATFSHISFEHATFEKDAHFEDVKLIIRKERYSVFKQTHFKGGAYFNNATLKNVWFQLTVFSGVAEFNEATLIDVSFDSATFKGRVSFEGTTFKGNTRFSNAVFESFTWFWKSHDKTTVFEGNAVFQNASFRNKARFDNVIFKCGADFSKCVFESEVNFNWCKFFEENSDSKQIKSTMLPETTFAHSRFEGTTFFDFAEFGEAIFNFATFENGVTFKNAKFYGNAWFKECVFRNVIEFQSAEFKRDTHFEGGVFERSVIFVEEDFSKERKPKFHGKLDFQTVTSDRDLNS